MALTASWASSLPASHFALHTQPHWLALSIQRAKSIPTLEPLRLLLLWPETLFPRPPLGWLLLVIQQLVKCHLFGEVTSYLTPGAHSPASCLFSSDLLWQVTITYIVYLFIYWQSCFSHLECNSMGTKTASVLATAVTSASRTVPGTEVVRN